MRKAKIRNTDNIKCRKGCGGQEFLFTATECKVVQSVGKTVQWFLTKLNLLLSEDAAVMLLAVCSRVENLCPDKSL